MGKSNREKEIEHIDLSIKDIEDQKVQIREYAKVAEAIVSLENEDRWKLVIEKTFLQDEIDGIMSHLAGAHHVTGDVEEAMGKALNTIRSFKTFIKDTKALGDDVIGRLAACDKRIEEENAYKIDVLQGKIDLGAEDE